MDYPKLRIRVPQGRTVLTSVELDGRPLPATRVQFDTGDSHARRDGAVIVHLDFYADIDVEAEHGTPEVVAIDWNR